MKRLGVGSRGRLQSQIESSVPFLVGRLHH